jgi:hypothetical protein
VSAWSEGLLPADGEAVVGGVRLPAGTRISVPRCRLGRPAPSALWVTGPSGNAIGLWLTLRERLAGSGLVPLLLSDLAGQPGRPWESGELSRPADPDAVAGLDARTLLPALWDRHVPVPEEDQELTAEVLDPYSRAFPGLAPASGGRAGTEQLTAAAESLDGPLRIGLVMAGRPADTLASVGWQGAVNCYDSPAPLTVVLRSWEERFAATVMRVGFDLVDLLVERPVTSMQAALAVAAEHFAFCSDNVYQGAGSIREYAEELPGATRWSFWWD